MTLGNWERLPIAGTRRPRRGATVALAALAVLVLCAATHRPVVPPSPEGERLYREGEVAPGQALVAEREGATPLEGRAAACVNCHRRSGLGTVEGRIVIPPITGRYLFHPGERLPPESDATHTPSSPPNRAAYDDATVARAIREGIGADGRQLNYLMPRFKLDAAAMASVIAYLKYLSSEHVPGVTQDTLHFATIITPDADPVLRAGVLNVLQQFFASKNSYFRGDTAPPLQSARRIHFRVQRKWQLHVWQLTGAADTWEAQLDTHLRDEPVYAVISGLAGRTWAPVHRFCERQRLPCLLPQVDLPVVAEGDFYPVYFSQGVLLEARLVAELLAAAPSAAAPHRLVQVYRDDDIGADAAAALAASARAQNLEVVDRALGHGATPATLARSLGGIGDGDALVLWLRPRDLQKLPATPPKAAAIYASGLIGGLEDAPLPTAWRSVIRLTYPFELPNSRRIPLNYPLAWFRIRNVPVVAERVQTETYLACAILAETLGSMLDDFVREYLIERLEVMLSSRIINAYYPRLSLAPGQRFASKGGYIVHFTEAQGTAVAADGDWIVP